MRDGRPGAQAPASGRRQRGKFCAAAWLLLTLCHFTDSCGRVQHSCRTALVCAPDNEPRRCVPRTRSLSVLCALFSAPLRVSAKGSASVHVCLSSAPIESRCLLGASCERRPAASERKKRRSFFFYSFCFLLARRTTTAIEGRAVHRYDRAESSHACGATRPHSEHPQTAAGPRASRCCRAEPSRSTAPATLAAV